jgi:hypothetical protein
MSWVAIGIDDAGLDWDLTQNQPKLICTGIDMIQTLLSDKPEFTGDGDASGCMSPAARVMKGVSSISQNL